VQNGRKMGAKWVHIRQKGAESFAIVFHSIFLDFII